MTPALALLHSALAAAEPGSRKQILVSDNSNRTRVIAVPSNLRSIPSFVAGVVEAYGMRERELERVCTVDDLNYVAIQDYVNSVLYFDGTGVKLHGEVRTGKVVYAPKVGHIPDFHDHHYPELVKRPDAVVYTGYVYVHVDTQRFGSALAWLVKNSAVVGAGGLDYEPSWIGDKFALIMRTVDGNPRTTAKQIPELEARTEALKSDLMERARNLVACCNRFQEFNAVKAFRLEPVK